MTQVKLSDKVTKHLMGAQVTEVYDTYLVVTKGFVSTHINLEDDEIESLNEVCADD